MKTSLVTIPVETSPIVLKIPTALDINDDLFFEFCQINRDLRIERTSEGEIIIMSPTGSETGGINFDLIYHFATWVKQDGTGKGFDSSTGFKLPNGANRSPDVAWVKLDRWQRLTRKQRRQFAPICPDFVIELCSPNDRVEDLKNKMEEYIENGARLGCLIDPDHRQVYIYRPGALVEQLDNPTTVSGESVLPGFVLTMAEIWQG